MSACTDVGSASIGPADGAQLNDLASPSSARTTMPPRLARAVGDRDAGEAHGAVVGQRRDDQRAEPVPVAGASAMTSAEVRGHLHRLAADLDSRALAAAC